MPGIECKRCGGPATAVYGGRGGALLIPRCDNPECLPGSKRKTKIQTTTSATVAKRESKRIDTASAPAETKPETAPIDKGKTNGSGFRGTLESLGF